MSDSEFLSEDGLTGTQEFHPKMHGTSEGGGGLIWDPISKTYVPRSEKQQPLRTQVPGMPIPETFQEKTKNPQFEGVFAKYAATRMVQLDKTQDDWGVYSDRARGPYDTPLVFRGTFDECRQWIREEGRYASTVISSDDELAQAKQYRDTANDFEAQAGRAPNVGRREWLLEKANYYRTLADQLSPDHAQNGAPDARSLGDVYQDVVPKRNPGMTDDTFPSSISSHTPKVRSMSSNSGHDNHYRISLGTDDANLRDCPEGGCGGLMGDHDGESMCHNCGHKEKIHYAGFLAPLLAPIAEGLVGGAAADVAGGAAAEAIGGSAMKSVAPLMGKVMGGGLNAASGGAASTPDTGGSSGSAVADESMRTAAGGGWDGIPSWQYSGDPYVDLGVAEEKLHFGEISQGEYDALLQRAQISRPEDYPDESYASSDYDDGGEGDEPYDRDPTRTGSSVSEEDSSGFGTENSGRDSLPDSGNRGSEGQDRAAQDLDGDVDGAGGSQGMRGLDVFEIFKPYLENIADNDDSHEDPIAKMVHDLLEADHPGYLEKAARFELTMLAGGTCPTCHIDLSTAQQCGGATNITCPVGLPHPAGAQVQVNPASLGQPVGQPLVASIHEAKPKMCPVHEQMVNYALTLQDPAAAVGALSSQLFSEHSCQGGWMGENRNGNPIKCKYKPEMITQAYWDEKNEQAEQRKLEREQLQAQQELATPIVDVEHVEPAPGVERAPEAEGVLVGGPAFEEQIEQTRGPVTQEIPALDGLQSPDDYIPAEQGAEVIQFPTQQQEPQYQQQVAASFKWSGPKLSLLGIGEEDAPKAGPEEMFQDTPPEEQPAEESAGLISEGPTDTDGNPLEVGQTYEVTSSNTDDAIPDRYTISGVDPNGSFIQVEVEPQPGQPFGFTNTISTMQIKAEGLNFAPASEDANARGEISTDQDNTKGSDEPGSVTDLDTGGNSHASKTADYHQNWDNEVADRKWETRDPNACAECEGRGCDNCGGTGRTDQVNAQAPVTSPLKQYSSDKTAVIDFSEGYGIDEPPYGTPRVDQGENDVHWMDEARADSGMDEKAELAPLVRLREMMLEKGFDEKTINALLNEYWAEQRADQGRAKLVNPTGEQYGLDEDDMEGMHDPDLMPALERESKKLTGNPSLDWLNDDDDTPQQKTAGRDFSMGEQRGFVNEMGAARNLDKLDLSGTHYPTDTDDDPYSNFLW